MKRLGSDENGVTPVIESVMLLVIVVGIVGSFVAWALPAIDNAGALSEKNSAVNGMIGVRDSIDDAIAGGEGTSRTATVSAGSGSFTSGESGDRIITQYSSEEGYSFDVSGLDDDDVNFGLDVSQGQMTKVVAYDADNLDKLTESWWDQDWIYRTQIDITEKSGEFLTDYQIPILITPNNFNYSRAAADGADIRFTLLNPATNFERPLSYYIHDWNPAGESKIWIKVARILGDETAIVYMYYGNADASSESDGDDVFLFWDNFETDKKWVYDETLTYTSWGYSVSEYTSASTSLLIENPDGANVVDGQYARVYKDIVLPSTDEIIVEGNVMGLLDGDIVTDTYIKILAGSSETPENPSEIANIIIPPSSTPLTIPWGERSGPHSPESTTMRLSLQLYYNITASGISGRHAWFDDVIVRKCASPEPTVNFGIYSSSESWIDFFSGTSGIEYTNDVEVADGEAKIYYETDEQLYYPSTAANKVYEGRSFDVTTEINDPYSDLDAVDGTHVSYSTSWFYYPYHRFEFNIAEDPVDITEIEITWLGYGYHWLFTRGYILYVYNYDTLGWDYVLSYAGDEVRAEHVFLTGDVGKYLSGGPLKFAARSYSYSIILGTSINTDYIDVRVEYISYRPTSGDMRSTALEPYALNSWLMFESSQNLPANTAITYSILNAEDDSVIASFPASGSGTTYDLSSIDPLAVPGIKLQADLSRSQADAGNPTIYYWRITWKSGTDITANPAVVGVHIPLTDVAAIELYNGTRSVGLVWLFDLGSANYQRSSMTTNVGIILENGGIIDRSAGEYYMRSDPTGFVSNGNTFVAKMTQMVTSGSPGGANTNTFELTFVKSVLREDERIWDFKISMYGPYSTAWLGYFEEKHGFSVSGETATHPLAASGVQLKLIHSVIDIAVR